MAPVLHFRRGKPGDAPGVEHDKIQTLPGGNAPVYVSCIDYSLEQTLFQNVDDLDEFLKHHRPDWSAVRWINVDGLSDMGVIHALAEKYNLHPLAIEDVLNTPERPKVEPIGGSDSEYQARLFIITRMLQIQNGALDSEQISIFLGHKTVLTFQEGRGDVWDPIRQRIRTKGSRLRMNDASFLVYALLDAVVDHIFPILENYSNRLEDLEDGVLADPQRSVITAIHKVKRDLLLVRRAAWPMREMIAFLQREPHECMGDVSRIYMRDIYDHIVQIIDILETYRELANDLTDTYMSSISNRMNEIMKVLTIIGTIFIPLTFLAGVYGMNFHYFPELGKAWAYPAFWAVCIVLVVCMLAWFRRRNWL
ncbi:MAG: magnesium/cobalt transporter CorA [Acidobacteria bacterium]|nr:magnesium/cobalt transporter CorA [Acidobacteriota bacterium]